MPLFIVAGLVMLSTILQPLADSSTKFFNNLPQSTVEAATVEIPPLDVEARGVYVKDLKNSEPIIAYHKNETWSIASLTKVMTAVVFLDENPDLDEYVAFTKEDFVGGATLKVRIGTLMTGRDLLHSSLMSSANNSTNALIHATTLSKEEFVNKMNDKARDFGLKHTTFTEPTGLDPENKSTPEEYAKIIAYALSKPLIREIMGTTYYEIKPRNMRAFPIGTTNKLLKSEQEFEVIGGKTGFTDGSDYNFASLVKKGDKEMVVVVFGDKTFNSAIESNRKLAEEGFATENKSE